MPSDFPVAKRVFHRDRNSAVLLGLLDTADRLREMLSLRADDYRAKERQIVIRESKGRKPRTLPVSAEWVEALAVWLRQRTKIMAGQEDDEGRFLKALHKNVKSVGGGSRGCVCPSTQSHLDGRRSGAAR